MDAYDGKDAALSCAGTYAADGRFGAPAFAADARTGADALNVMTAGGGLRVVMGA